MRKLVITPLTVLIITLSTSALFAWKGGAGGCGYNGYPGMQWFGFFHGGGMFMGIFTFVLTGLLIFFGINYFRKNGVSAGGKEKPLEILKIRYAKGEITKAEFDTMKREIAGE